MTSRLSSLAVCTLLAALGAVAWSGCGPGSSMRYYCDSGGCYSCDAYGCSSVAPPAVQACTGNASCSAGSVCTSNGCATTCSDDTGCPKGNVCESSLCVAPGTSPGAVKECTTKADCGDGKSCVAGTCQACGGTAGPCPCAAANECSNGQACVGGSCTAPQNSCKFSSECESGKVCADGQCLTSCESAPCADGFTCDKSVCKPSTVGPTSCSGDAQCPATTPRCVAGSCVRSCTTDPECGAGNYCNQGACLLDTRPKPNCTDDSQCGGTSATPKRCLDGFCKYTCASDQYCRTIDSRIGYCAKDSVCRTAAEASAECLTTANCTGGKACIDNACK